MNATQLQSAIQLSIQAALKSKATTPAEIIAALEFAKLDLYMWLQERMKRQEPNGIIIPIKKGVVS